MNVPQKIMLVENDVQTARTLRDALKTVFPQIQVMFDGAAASKSLLSEEFDVMLLDRNALSGTDCAQLCREIRKASAVPVLVFSGRTDALEKARILDAGADDYMEKPLDICELAARIRAVWRRYLTVPPVASPQKEARRQYVQYPQLFISLSNYAVQCDDKSVDMPPKELELLYFLASSPNQVFTREQLLDHVWGYDYIGDARTVDVHIKRIRKKIKDHAAWSLDTVWGVGYKFSLRSSHILSNAPSAQAEQTHSV